MSAASFNFRIPAASNKVGAPDWPIGSYRVRLINLAPEDENKFKPEQLRIRWEFEVVAILSSLKLGEARRMMADEEIMMAWANLTMGRKAKMRQYAEALLDRELDEGEEIGDPGVLLGRECVAHVVETDKEGGGTQRVIGRMVGLSQVDLDDPDAGTSAAAIDAPTQPVNPGRYARAGVQPQREYAAPPPDQTVGGFDPALGARPRRRPF
jgi:hypothetical protein